MSDRLHQQLASADRRFNLLLARRLVVDDPVEFRERLARLVNNGGFLLCGRLRDNLLRLRILLNRACWLVRIRLTRSGSTVRRQD